MYCVIDKSHCFRASELNEPVNESVNGLIDQTNVEQGWVPKVIKTNNNKYQYSTPKLITFQILIF